MHKILIANRGEIACRVMRTARRLGYRTVAVFSEADAGAPHTRLADEAVPIGAAPASASYLNIDALLQAARRTGADAVHPGYGFLSERAAFAQACADAGLVFIGPPAAAIAAMGNKADAKRRMMAAGVPCVPGHLGDDNDDAQLAAQAAALGLPLLVKAVAGGGGRGMRLVRDLAELPAALAAARREAESAFGDGTLMLERLVENGRHVEVQVFADTHGNVVHLGERDCTAQRRRQKLIEEAPSPIVDDTMRRAMGAAAVAAARSVGYVGAGTVEFIVDARRDFYFLEMNTRLQVEHPVTECITGLDLVEWQLRVAEGEPLPLQQHEIRFEGHAIEARLVAEDPADGWAPRTGRILGWRPQDAGIRVDDGIAAGGEITPWYDAMVAKFVAHGRNRADAVRRLVRALEDAPLLGVAHNGRFLRDLLRHPAFTDAQLTTTRVDEWAAAGEALLRTPVPPEDAWAVAAAAWCGPPGARPASVAGFDLTLECAGQRRTLRMPAAGVQVTALADGWLHAVIDGIHRRWPAQRTPTALHLAIDAAVFVFHEPSPHPAAAARDDPARARAPVAGVVAQLRVRDGERVAAGQPLLSVEAMKMEMWIHATAAGTVRAIRAQPGAAVAAGAVLVELELSSEA